MKVFLYPAGTRENTWKGVSCKESLPDQPCAASSL